ncbi:hypothetical protein [Candidatus Aquiluna sp. UB-MaderosW2red]|jgi:CDP-diglyceride synthetase|uniref:hypothetical protein n=1 Tax=Candidatus Aquiluna sp. UB-MaderosW2red TaxID=1855377 RepID=UPI000875E244|nr:hypothetical protein [Candidatus Aquiluna sp. UB-MaderosW2red]SCX08501.1 hypothetical protein SAMN05216534_0789 [Candidatus Aquiluna sp. UB-MaderosW2red]
MSEKRKRPQVEVTLAYMAVGVIGASILAILLTLVLTLFKVSDMPVLLAQLPLIGLPVGFLLIIGLLIASIITRTKGNKD